MLRFRENGEIRLFFAKKKITCFSDCAINLQKNILISLNSARRPFWATLTRISAELGISVRHNKNCDFTRNMFSDQTCTYLYCISDLRCLMIFNIQNIWRDEFVVWMDTICEYLFTPYVWRLCDIITIYLQNYLLYFLFLTFVFTYIKIYMYIYRWYHL